MNDDCKDCYPGSPCSFHIDAMVNADIAALREKLERAEAGAASMREALKLFADLDWRRLVSYSKDYLEGRFSAEIMDHAVSALATDSGAPLLAELQRLRAIEAAARELLDEQFNPACAVAVAWTKLRDALAVK